MKRLALTIGASAMVAASVLAPLNAEARAGVRHGYHGHYAYRHYRHGNRAAGAAVAGVAGALIGGAIAASQRPRYGYGYYEQGYGYPAPAYGPAPYGYYDGY